MWTAGDKQQQADKQCIACRTGPCSAAQASKQALQNALATRRNATASLAKAQEAARSVKDTAMHVPGMLLKLEAQILGLERSSIPLLKGSLLGLRMNATASEVAAKVAGGAVEAAQKLVMRADEQAAAAELAWQTAEDRVDALLQKHNSLMSQISTMAEFFQAQGPKPAAAAGSNSSSTASGTGVVAGHTQVDLMALGKALLETQSQVMSIQSTKQDTAAALAEARLAAEKQAAAAAAAEEKFRAAAAQLAASEVVVARLQQQLVYARKQLQVTSADLHRKQEAATSAMLDLQGKQSKLVQSAAAAKAARRRQEQATATLATAVAASLQVQSKLSAAMAELQNLKAEEKNVVLDLRATEEQQRRLQSLLVSANASALATQVCAVGCIEGVEVQQGIAPCMESVSWLPS